MDSKSVFLILLDISGYTRFIKFHRISLIHAERIIDELLETVMAALGPPLVLHELEGDAVYYYAVADCTPQTAGGVYQQIQRGMAAFRKREAELISDCAQCPCEACKVVGKLSLKAIVHHGQAVFTRVRQFTKVSGEDVILAHRLLKNSVGSREYVLVTDAVHKLAGTLGDKAPEHRTEECEGLGPVDVRIYYPPQEAAPDPSAKGPPLTKGKLFLRVIKRLFLRPPRPYRNLEAAQRPGP